VSRRRATAAICIAAAVQAALLTLAAITHGQAQGGGEFVARSPALFLDASAPYLHGLSAIAVDERGAYWVLPERALTGSTGHLMVPVTMGVSGGTVSVTPGAAVRFDLTLPNLDTESLAWLSGGAFVVGTEGQEDADDAGELLFFVGPDGGSNELELPADSGFEKRTQHGIEAMCAAGPWVIAAPERSARPIPLAVIDARRHALARVRHLLLPAATQGDVLSGMTCRERDGGIEVLAIGRRSSHTRSADSCERSHLHHLIGFWLDPAAHDDVVAGRVRDLDDAYDRLRGGGAPCDLVNLEGIAPLGDGGDYVLISDDTLGPGAPTGGVFFVFHRR